MDLAVLEQATAALGGAGFRTYRAYPGMDMPAVTQVMAAVQVAQAQFADRKITLEAKLLCPQKMGASACEDAAFRAGQALTDSGFNCTVGSVTFDGRAALFCVSCMASVEDKKEMPDYIPLIINTLPQKCVISFTAKRQTDEIVTVLKNAPWTLRLEQFFPTGETEDVDFADEQFVLNYGSEKYTGCVWTSHMRVMEVDGVRQIWEGTATNRTIQ